MNIRFNSITVVIAMIVSFALPGLSRAGGFFSTYYAMLDESGVHRESDIFVIFDESDENRPSFHSQLEAMKNCGEYLAKFAKPASAAYKKVACSSGKPSEILASANHVYQDDDGDWHCDIKAANNIMWSCGE